MPVAIKSTSGGSVTIAAATTASDYTLTLPASTGTAVVADGSGNVSTSGSVTGASFIPTGSTVPANGMFLATTSTPAWSSASTERMRINSTGYLKVSNNGSYLAPTTDLHEFSSTANFPCMFDITNNASFTDAVTLSRCSRAASSAFVLYSAETSSGSNRSFALRGDGNGYADGTWNNNGADYAEFFESSTGLAIPVGTTVVLDGNKVRASSNEDASSMIIGVVRPKEASKASMVIGNTAWNKWADKYLTDDFGRYITEDHVVYEWDEVVVCEDGSSKTIRHSYESNNIPVGVVVPDGTVGITHDNAGNKFEHYKLNPAYDDSIEYTPREKRDEWLIIGLIGQVPVLNGQPVGDRWIKMRDISASVSEYMIR